MDQCSFEDFLKGGHGIHGSRPSGNFISANKSRYLIIQFHQGINTLKFCHYVGKRDIDKAIYNFKTISFTLQLEPTGSKFLYLMSFKLLCFHQRNEVSFKNKT
jgi:hypothetical protein